MTANCRELRFFRLFTILYIFKLFLSTVKLYFYRGFEYNLVMFKIWAKILKDGKIIKQTVYENDDKFSYSSFFTYLSDVCERLDVATPVLLKTHVFNYAKFSTVRFIPRDFAEPVDFDKLVLDRIDHAR